MKYLITCLTVFIQLFLFGSPPSLPQNQLEPSVVDLEVLFQFTAPYAKQVNLTGSFPDNQWLIDGYGTDVMYDDGTNGDRITGDGVWSIIKRLKNGKYEYKFVVDRKLWFNDPNACSSYLSSYDNFDSRMNSVIIVQIQKNNLVGFGFTNIFKEYDYQAKPILKTPVKYPDDAKSSSIEGVVVLQVEIFYDGTIGSTRVLQSLLSGPGGLDEAAVKTVKQWKFAPAISDGKPISTWLVLEINFSRNEKN